MDLEYICVCGHVFDEHQTGMMFAPCQIEGCDCDDYEATESDDE